MATPMDNALQLKDIHLPESPGFWPLAPGWWILLILLMIIGVWLVFAVLRKIKQRKYQQKIIDQYAVLETSLLEKPDNERIAAINTFLRQLAINKYPRADIASLTGAKWLAFLDKSGKTQNFSKGAGRILIDAPYQSVNLHNFNNAEFIPLIRAWVKKVVAQSNKGSIAELSVLKNETAESLKKGGGGYV